MIRTIKITEGQRWALNFPQYLHPIIYGNNFRQSLIDQRELQQIALINLYEPLLKIQIFRCGEPYKDDTRIIWNIKHD